MKRKRKSSWENKTRPALVREGRVSEEFIGMRSLISESTDIGVILTRRMGLDGKFFSLGCHREQRNCFAFQLSSGTLRVLRYLEVNAQCRYARTSALITVRTTMYLKIPDGLAYQNIYVCRVHVSSTILPMPSRKLR